MQIVLSLFPGIGLLDRAFALEGWQTVRGSDPLWGGDIRDDHYPPGVFQGVIGGPPCQSFSSLVHLVRANGHEPRFGNLIPEFERVVGECLPAWFLMENVPAAPVAQVPGYGIHDFVIDNSMLDSGDGFGHEQRRLRRFSFGLRGREPVNLMRWIDLAVFVLPDAARCQTQYPVNNTPEAKGRKPAIHAGHDQTPYQRDGDKGRVRKRTVTALGPDHLQGLRDSTNEVNRVRRSATTADRRKTPVAIGGSGKPKPSAVRSGAVTASDGGASNRMSRYRLADACRLQGLPEDFLADAPFTADGKLKAVANGVPIGMGRAIARAVKEALASQPLSEDSNEQGTI